jgi:hypothetical protein
MQHLKHAIMQQNIFILIHQFGSGFFTKVTDLPAVMTSRSIAQVNGFRVLHLLSGKCLPHHMP